MMDTMSNTNETLVGDKVKRNRTSPRVKAIDETIRLLDEHLSDLSEELKEGDNEAVKTQLTSKVQVMSDFRGKLVALSKEGVTKPEYNGRHWIGIAKDEARVAFDCNTVPSIRSHGPESKHGYVKCFGPFRTIDGRALRIEKPEMLAEHTPVF